MNYLIYMAIRLMEMRRLLKSAGSIYLHCDPTASHYIKLLMDSVFGRSRFRNEVIWKRRQDTHNLATKSMGAAHDTIFWYGDWRDSEYRRQFTPYDKSYLKSHYRHKDSRGLYRMLPCTNETGGNVQYDFREVFRAWRFKPETMQRMFDNDLLIQLNAEGPYYYKKYLADAAGVPLQDVWFDIPPARGKERTGYPTQKPLSLIERIIMASSDPGHVVLDPFCGCATACIAAQRLQRGWVGIDISAKAADLVQSRMRDDLGISSKARTARTFRSAPISVLSSATTTNGTSGTCTASRAAIATAARTTLRCGISTSITSSHGARVEPIT